MASESGGPLRRLLDSPVTSLVARIVVGGMFILLGFAKLGDQPAFLKAIHEYDMIPAGDSLTQVNIWYRWGLFMSFITMFTVRHQAANELIETALALEALALDPRTGAPVK